MHQKIDFISSRVAFDDTIKQKVNFTDFFLILQQLKYIESCMLNYDIMNNHFFFHLPNLLSTR